MALRFTTAGESHGPGLVAVVEGLPAGLEAQGDGSCAPSRARCTYLTLRPDRRHDQAFLEDARGRRWSLRLDALERVPLDEAATPADDAPALGSTVEDR